MLIVKVPSINGLEKTKGCEKAPNKILEALKDIYLTEEEKEIKYAIDEIAIDKNNIEKTNKSIFDKAKELIKKEKDKTIFLGGDHNISYSLLKAFSSVHESSGLIVFDAHADCMHNFKPPTHEDWLRVLIEEGFPAENIILVGLRDYHKIEKEFLHFKQINCFSCKELFENLQESCDSIMEAAKAFPSLYISIDVDVTDPAFAPATGYIEPAGLSSREFLYLLQRLLLLKNLKAADIVEINPDKDINNLTAKLGAKILAELI